MNEIEASVVARIVLTADGGCRDCVAALTCQLVKDLPWHDWFDIVAEASQGEWTAAALQDASCAGPLGGRSFSETDTYG